MAGYKEPSFQDRVSAAAQAREKALAKLKAKPAIDPAELARLNAERLAKETAQAEKRAAAKAEREAAKAEQAAIAEEARLAALALIKSPEEIEAERKAARDARYAARKASKTKKGGR
ncbi:MAG: DUF6481 family protein [Novosphingobium sp.]